MPVRPLDIILAAMLFVMAAFSFYLYSQHRSAVQESRSGVEALKSGLKEQGVEFEKLRQENAQITVFVPQIKDSVAELKSVISQSRVDAMIIKEDVKQWQKDYVAVLIEIEERLNFVENALKEFQGKLPDGYLQQLQQEFRSLKDRMEKISPSLSAPGVLTPDPS